MLKPLNSLLGSLRPRWLATGARPRTREALVLLALTLAWVLAATWLTYNAYLPIHVAAGDEVRQVFYDFQPIERNGEETFRWTTGSSRICLDQSGGIPRAIVRLSVIGGYAMSLGTTSATLLANDTTIAVLPMAAATRRYHMLVHEALNGADTSCFVLSSRTTTPPGEERQIGVPVVSLSLEPLRGERLVRPALLQLLLNLGLALVALWIAQCMGVGLRPVVLGVIGLITLLTAAILARWVEPGLGVARSMLPLVLGAALLGGGAIAAGRLRARFGARPRWQLAADLLGMVFWSAALYGLTRLFQLLLGVSGMWPMKAGLAPAPPVLLAAPLALFAAWIGAVLWLHGAIPASSEGARAARWPRWAALALVLGGAIVLPIALKASVRGWGSLFATFTDNPFEYISDVARVGDDPLGFLRDFVTIAPGLALHSSTHPPGNILLLWAVARTFGPGPAPASLAAIALSSLLPLAALWLGGRLGGARLGLLAGALAVVMPGHQIYSVTSMDGVFNGLLALGAVAFFLCLEPGARPRAAVLAGALITTALLFTYAATQLAFFGLGAVVVAALRRRAAAGGAGGWRPALAPVLGQALIAGAVVACAVAGVALLTGLNLVTGAVAATATNATVMRGVAAGAQLRAFAPPNLAYYALHLVANLLPFAWYIGPWGLQATTSAGGRALRARPLGPTAGLALAVTTLVGGMWLSGLFNREVERIWAFAYPLLAALVAAHVVEGGDARDLRWRAGLYLGLFAAHAMFIRLVLNTYW